MPTIRVPRSAQAEFQAVKLAFGGFLLYLRASENNQHLCCLKFSKLFSDMDCRGPLDCKVLTAYNIDISIAEGDHPCSTILSSEFPQDKFPPRKVHFPHLHFHQNRQFSFSANFRRTQKLNNSSKFYYYKEYSLKVHVSNFRNGGK